MKKEIKMDEPDNLLDFVNKYEHPVFRDKIIKFNKEEVEEGRTKRTREILLLLKAFDLNKAIHKIETTYRDELNTLDTEKLKEGK